MKKNCHSLLEITSFIPRIFTVTALSMQQQKNNYYKVSVRTNAGKQTIASTASRVWQTLPTELKSLKTTSFSKIVKQYLLLRQIGS